VSSRESCIAEVPASFAKHEWGQDGFCLGAEIRRMVTILDYVRNHVALVISFTSVPALLVAAANWLRLLRVKNYVLEHQENLIQWADLAAGLDTLDQVVAVGRAGSLAEAAKILEVELGSLRTALANLFRCMGRGTSEFLLWEARRLRELGHFDEASDTFERVLNRDARFQSLDRHQRRICYVEWQDCCLATLRFGDAKRVHAKAVEDGLHCCLAPDEIDAWRMRHPVRVRLRGLGYSMSRSLLGGSRRFRLPSNFK